jgi:hypothetical protein
MANITGYVGINVGDAVLATVVSNNFDKIKAAINSNALNSENYGRSAVKSQNIDANAVLSQHISNSQILSQHLSNNAVVHDKLNFASASDGARILQIGAGAASMPAGGVAMCAVTQAATMASNATSLALTHEYTDGIWGDPGYTGPPTIGGAPIFQQLPAAVPGPMEQRMSEIDSASCVMIYHYSASAGSVVSITAHARFDGPL